MSQHSSLADRAYAELRSAIVSRRLAPGSALVEAELAAMLGISRTPVREALRRCELEGYLQRDANGRLVIDLPTPAEVARLFEVRELVECYAVRLAAERISDAELEQLDRLVAEDLDALRARDADRLAELNGAIHNTLFEASRNRTLCELIGALQGRAHGLEAFAVGDSADRERFVADHRRLVELLRASDGDAAVTLMRSHLRHARELLLTDSS